MEENYKPRKISIAILFSLIVPGLGQIYNGQWKKGLYYFFGLLSLIIGINLFSLKPYFWVYAFTLLLMVILRIINIIDAAIVAKKSVLFIPQKYNKWYINLIFLAVFYGIAYFSSGINEVSRYQNFKISSNSGAPNIIPGDYILADMKAYEDKNPDYGDMMIISSKKYGKVMYRVVGLPFDTLSIEKNVVKIKNKVTKVRFISEKMLEQIPVDELIETLPNNFSHRIYRNKIPIDSLNSNISRIIVPPYSYFVLGDNRDGAEDSRYIGFITSNRIQGKLLKIYFSTDLKKINSVP